LRTRRKRYSDVPRYWCTSAAHGVFFDFIAAHRAFFDFIAATSLRIDALFRVIRENSITVSATKSDERNDERCIVCICLYTAIISWANNRRVFGDGRRISKDSAGSRNYDDQFLASGMSNRIAFVYLFVEHEGNGFCQSALSQCNSSPCVRRGCKGKSIVAKNYGKCVIAVVRGRIAGTWIIPWLECWSKIICEYYPRDKAGDRLLVYANRVICDGIETCVFNVRSRARSLALVRERAGAVQEAAMAGLRNS